MGLHHHLFRIEVQLIQDISVKTAVLQHWLLPMLRSSLSPGGTLASSSFISIRSAKSVTASFCLLTSPNRSLYTILSLAMFIFITFGFLHSKRCCCESSRGFSSFPQHFRGHSTFPPCKFRKLHLKESEVRVRRENKSLVSSLLNSTLFK